MAVRISAGRLLAAPRQSENPEGASITLEGGRIAAIEVVDRDRLPAEERGKLLMPALANAHDHGRGLRTIAVGAADDKLEEWAVALARHPKVDPYLVAVAAFARQAESGVGVVNHCHNPQDTHLLYPEAEAVSRAARDVGVRVAFAMPFADRNPLVYGDLGELLRRVPPEDRPRVAAVRQRSRELNFELCERIAALEHECFTMQYGPVAPQWTEDATLEAIAQASANDGRRVHMHLLETKRQREWSDAFYPQGLIHHLDDIGLLTPRLTVAHAVWLREDECELLASRGVHVSINASSNLRLRSGLPPIDMIRRTGLSFGIGLDGMSLDDDEDMLREMRLLGLLGGVGDLGPLDPGELLEACCAKGRTTIVGEDAGGRIMAGAPADLLVLDFEAIARDFVREDFDVARLLLSRATRRHVVDLWIDGKRVVREGRCTTVDLPAIEDELLRAARAALATGDVPAGYVEGLQTGISGFFESGCHMHGRD